MKFADGKPLTGGSIECRPSSQSPRIIARGRIAADGSFKLTTFRLNDGAVEGPQKLVITPLVEISEGKAMPAMPIDRKYLSYETSPLEFNVSSNAPSNHWDVIVDRPQR